MENCLFCALAQGNIPSHTVYSDDKFFAFLDINPANPGHLIVAPRAHFRTIMEMEPQDYAQMFMVSRILSLALLESGAEGVNIMHSMGEAAGQRIPHVITHVIPRYKSDSVHLVWDPQKVDEAKLEELRKQIAEKIKIPQPGQIPQMPQAQAPQKENVPEPEPKVYTMPPKTAGYW